MFVAYQVSLDLVRGLVPVVEKVRGHDRELADQLRRAATSVALNLAEGHRRSGRDRGRFFAMAAGSGGEVRAALDVAEAWGWSLTGEDVRPVLDRLLALLWGLTHPSRPG